MSWLFGGGGKKSPTGQWDARAARDRQISNLQERVPALTAESKDNSLFEVQITGPDGARVMMRVFLPTKFPAERPGEKLTMYFGHWHTNVAAVVGARKQVSEGCRTHVWYAAYRAIYYCKVHRDVLCYACIVRNIRFFQSHSIQLRPSLTVETSARRLCAP